MDELLNVKFTHITQSSCKGKSGIIRSFES